MSMLLTVIFIIWAQKAANSYLLATMAKQIQENYEQTKESECDCCNNETKKARRIRDVKLTAPWLSDLLS